MRETREFDEDPDQASGEDLKLLSEQIDIIRSECAHVFDDPDTGDMLEQLIADAEEFYETDKAGWRRHLKDTKDELLRAVDRGEDETQTIKDILRAAITKATTELM